MKNTTKIILGTVGGAVVAGALAYAQDFPPNRVLISAGLGAAVMLGLFIVLKFRP